jgi:hypothetical protein
MSHKKDDITYQYDGSITDVKKGESSEVLTEGLKINNIQKKNHLLMNKRSKAKNNSLIMSTDQNNNSLINSTSFEALELTNP